MACQQALHCTAQQEWLQHEWLPSAQSCPKDGTWESAQKWVGGEGCQ